MVKFPTDSCLENKGMINPIRSDLPGPASFHKSHKQESITLNKESMIILAAYATQWFV